MELFNHLLLLQSNQILTETREKKTRQCFHLIHTMTLHVSGENIDYQHNNSIQYIAMQWANVYVFYIVFN